MSELVDSARLAKHAKPMGVVEEPHEITWEPSPEGEQELGENKSTVRGIESD